MEINATPPAAAQNLVPTAPAPGKETANTVLPKAATVQEAPKAAPVKHENAQAKAANRQVAIARAAQLFKDVYAVSDSTFTIYKDANGQYVTRFTSLRDGKVTYFPEQELLRFYEQQVGLEDKLVQIDV